MQHIATLLGATDVAYVWPPCCDVLRHDSTRFWLKFENGQILHAAFVDVAWCCCRLARFMQQRCAWACALIRFSTDSQHFATHCNRVTKRVQHVVCPTMLRLGLDVVIVWPELPNVRPTLLGYATMWCCCRLAGVLYHRSKQAERAKQGLCREDQGPISSKSLFKKRSTTHRWKWLEISSFADWKGVSNLQRKIHRLRVENCV